MMATGLHDVGRRLAGAGTAHADRKLKPARGTLYGTAHREQDEQLDLECPRLSNYRDGAF